MSTDIKRISVDEGAALWAKNGLTPKSGRYYSEEMGQTCACLVGAFVINARGIEPAETAYRSHQFWAAGDAAASLGLHPRYVKGLIMGFDGEEMSEDRDDLYDMGYADAAAIRQRVLPVDREGQGA